MKIIQPLVEMLPTAHIKNPIKVAVLFLNNIAWIVGGFDVNLLLL